MELLPALVTNSSLPDGAKTMADGVLPVGTPVPLLSIPLPKLIGRAVTMLSPWVVTNNSPVPLLPVDDLLLHPIKTSDTQAISTPAIQRDFIFILSPSSPSAHNS